MSGTQPVAVYAMKVPPGDIMVPAVPDFAAMFRVSMAAIDPSAAPEYDDVDEKQPPRSTLKLVRIPADMLGEDSEEDEDYEDDEDEDEEFEESSDEETNGGPSDPDKVKKSKGLEMIKKAMKLADDESMDSGDEDEESGDEAAARDALRKIMKGKAKANGEDDDSDLDEDEDSLEMDEVVICTLDPAKNYQQTLDFVVGEDERIFFKVSGTHTVHLTGNYVIPVDDGQAGYDDEDEEDEYDLSPDEDELDGLEELLDGEDESDELDGLADPRIAEIDSEDEFPIITKSTGKGKNKRPAQDSEEDEANLDDIMAKSLKAEEAVTNGEPKLSKSQMKKLKKLKKNDGEAAPAAPAASDKTQAENKTASDSTKKDGSANGEKKVQFAKNLEQGPTPSGTPQTKETKKAESKSSAGSVKEVQGVTIDDRKVGQGPPAKKGNKVGMRYIGKLENGKVFDSNKKGPPFSFKLGAGDVIKGWDIGIAGMASGGERRLTIPAHLGYGKSGAPPDIPPNSKLIFDVKLLTIK